MIDEWGKGAKYWDHAWNPMIGCRKVSEGCANCYAAHMAERFPELRDEKGGFEPHPPKNHKHPKSGGVLFVGNMTDIFGEWNSDATLLQWSSCLKLYPNPVKLILTKRPERLARLKYFFVDDRMWFGITGENQKRLEERIYSLSLFPHKNSWISLEPLLGEINLAEAVKKHPVGWVVVGAESGPNRRPCKLEWVRNIVRQCREAEIPVFVKQLDIDGKLEKDIDKFPEDLQIRQMPGKRLGDGE